MSTKENKFRTPLICSRGHRLFWYWSIVPGQKEMIDFMEETIVKDCNQDCLPFDDKKEFHRNGDDQQWSGENDINGAPIYDGDVVKVFPGTNLERLDMVIFSHGMFTKKNSPGSGIAYGNQIEVIGNVYETPQLLDLILGEVVNKKYVYEPKIKPGRRNISPMEAEMLGE
jgi:hypothetical protein